MLLGKHWEVCFALQLVAIVWRGVYLWLAALAGVAVTTGSRYKPNMKSKLAD